MVRYTCALVRLDPKHPLLPQTWSVVSRHESLGNALRSFDKRHAGAEADYRVVDINRRGRLETGNGFMTIADARACL